LLLTTSALLSISISSDSALVVVSVWGSCFATGFLQCMY